MNQSKKEKQYKYYTQLSMIYCTLLIASVLLPYKIINFFGYSEPGGILIFPLTYLLAGAVAEQYGRNLAIKMIYTSIFCLILFNLIITLIIHIPSIPTAPDQDIFLKAFKNGIWLSLGCLVGLICSDLTNIYKITGLKFFFGGKYFIQRCLWSTALSEGVFNILTYSITYYHVLPYYMVLKLMFYSWVLKLIYSVLMIIPLLILMSYLKKMEGTNIVEQNDPISWLNPEIYLLRTLLPTIREHS